MLERLSRERRNAALGILAVVLSVFAWSVRDVLNPLLLAYLLAFMAHPAVLNLERRGWSRMGAVNVIYAVLFAGTLLLSLGLWAQGNQLVRRMGTGDADGAQGLMVKLDQRFENFVEKYKDRAPIAWILDEEDATGGDEETAETLSGERSEDSEAVQGGDPSDVLEGAEASEALNGSGNEGPPPGDVPAGATARDEADAQAGTTRGGTSYFVQFIQRVWDDVSRGNQQARAGPVALRGAGSLMGVLSHWFGSVMGFFTLLFLLPIYTWYLLFELERIHGFVRRYVPDREKARVTRIGSEIGEVIAGFFRGRLVVCLLKGLLIAFGLWVTGLPYALFLGLFAGFLSLVPFIGALFGFVFAFLVLVLEPGPNDLLALALKTGIVFGVAEMIEGYVLMPKILGDTLGLHPLVVFVSVFVGGSALGMFGFLVALPLTAALIILCRELVLPALAEFADEPDLDEPEVEGPPAEEGGAPA